MSENDEKENLQTQQEDENIITVGVNETNDKKMSSELRTGKQFKNLVLGKSSGGELEFESTTNEHEQFFVDQQKKKPSPTKSTGKVIGYTLLFGTIALTALALASFAVSVGLGFGVFGVGFAVSFPAVVAAAGATWGAFLATAPMAGLAGLLSTAFPAATAGLIVGLSVVGLAALVVVILAGVLVNNYFNKQAANESLLTKPTGGGSTSLESNDLNNINESKMNEKDNLVQEAKQTAAQKATDEFAQTLIEKFRDVQHKSGSNKEKVSIEQEIKEIKDFMKSDEGVKNDINNFLQKNSNVDNNGIIQAVENNMRAQSKDLDEIDDDVVSHTSSN